MDHRDDAAPKVRLGSSSNLAINLSPEPTNINSHSLNPRRKHNRNPRLERRSITGRFPVRILEEAKMRPRPGSCARARSRPGTVLT
ncbi:hypothetical protein ColTof4_14025 [Colletotrichum tofieldiae]|nr:hypothetical protein ColTof3_14660 [Colletotrichum tofieldiae]GKT81602.1 hypothetical protein ColTof4_14025 [Colletotrichum tofieldiae]GKT97577.1 hypothetical protein Ct61P_15427 [Colletotrichum tofieldiae]